MHQQPQPRLATHERRLRHDPQPLPDLNADEVDHGRLTLAVLRELADAGPGASIYVPTHRFGTEKRQDHIRLKNLIAEVRRHMPSLSACLNAFRSETEDDAFWSHATEGLAWFGDELHSRLLWLPVTVPELAVRGSQRYIKPLLPIIASDGPFHLLELHQHGVRLHAGSKFGMHQVALEGIPTRVEELQHAGEGQRDIEVRALNATAGTPLWFGGAPEQDKKNLAVRYFRAVDQGVRSAVKVDQMPLILAGVAWLLPLYRQVSRHPLHWAPDLAIDTAAMSVAHLHQRGWEAASACYTQYLSAALERHKAARGTVRQSENLSDVLVCASEGRCASLMVGLDEERWGTYSDGPLSASVHVSRHEGDEDLLNVAAVLALRTGAEVWAVPVQMISGGQAVSALLRY